VFGCRHAPLALPPDVERALAAAYAEPHRAYHNAAHIAEVLRWYDLVADEAGWRDLTAVYLAVLFHDAVYDPLARDNEARSADLAVRLAGAPPRTTELILLTARHGALSPDSPELDADAAHFLDCDTAILGAPPSDFDAYDAAIALEYRAVPAAPSSPPSSRAPASSSPRSSTPASTRRPTRTSPAPSRATPPDQHRPTRRVTPTAAWPGWCYAV